MATLKQLAEAADAIYGYDDDDKQIIRGMASSDPEGLRPALEADPLVRKRLEWGW